MLTSKRLIVPTSLKRGVRKPKTYWLGLNQYHGWHYTVYHELKKQFAKEIADQVETLDLDVDIQYLPWYTLYIPTKRECDIENICPIISKFTLDVVVEHGKLKDDNYKILPKAFYEFGGVDKENPRCEVEFLELDEARLKMIEAIKGN